MFCRIYEVKGGIEHYDAVEARLGEGNEERPSGGHVHIAAVGEDGFKVIEVWDSAEDVERYLASGMGQAIQEVLGEAGVPEPQITDLEVHRLDWVE
jgi:hypothetical protein